MLSVRYSVFHIAPAGGCVHYDIVDGVITHFGRGCVISPRAGLINGRLMTAAQYWLSFRRQPDILLFLYRKML